jgi:MFS transporter, DHA1 family, multidrug resistance protein
VGLGTYVVTAFAVAGAPAIEAVAVLRLLQGIGSASAFVLSRAIVRDLFDVQGSARMYATVFQIIGVFPIVCPIIGGELTDWLGWRAVYVFIGCVGLASFAVIASAFRESLAEKDLDALRIGRIAASFGELLGDRSFRAYLVLGIGMHIGILAIVAGMPIAAIGYLGLSPATYGYLYAAVMVAYLVAAMIGGPLIRRFGPTAMLNLGIAISIGAVLLTLALWRAGAVNVVTVVLANAVFMFGYAWLNPPMVAGALANFHHMGALTAFAIGLVTDDTPRPHALAMLGAGAIILVAFVALVRRLPQPAHEGH